MLTKNISTYLTNITKASERNVYLMMDLKIYPRDKLTKSNNLLETIYTLSKLDETLIVHYNNAKLFVQVLENWEIFKNLNKTTVYKLNVGNVRLKS